MRSQQRPKSKFTLCTCKAKRSNIINLFLLESVRISPAIKKRSQIYITLPLFTMPTPARCREVINANGKHTSYLGTVRHECKMLNEMQNLVINK